MLTSGTAKKIGRGGIRLAAVLAALQLPVAVAEVAGHAATLGHTGNAECVGHSTMSMAMSIAQTVLGMFDACVVSHLVRSAGTLFSSDMILEPVQTAVGIVGHELVAHVFSLIIQVVS